jgi:hypothetical protein
MRYAVFMYSSKRAFSQIYETKFWGKGTKESPLSGPGSNPLLAKPYVQFVSKLIRLESVDSVLDIGHGDWAMWQDYRFQDTSYLGIDVVEGLSNLNVQLYGSQKIHFLEVNGDEDLPAAELLICKDVLQHLSISDIHLILSQVHKFRFVVICNDIHLNISLWRKLRFFLQPRARFRKFLSFEWPFYVTRFLSNNSEIFSGGYRGIDLESPVFATHFKQFSLIERLDFKAEHPRGTVKRIMYFQKKD